MAQDTGGAIRGVVRADLFWGFGAQGGPFAFGFLHAVFPEMALARRD